MLKRKKSSGGSNRQKYSDGNNDSPQARAARRRIAKKRSRRPRKPQKPAEAENTATMLSEADAAQLAAYHAAERLADARKHEYAMAASLPPRDKE